MVEVRPSATMGLIGYFVPFLLGLPSVKAKVIGMTDNQYILQQMYETQDKKGQWIIVEKTYYRDRWFIEAYCRDTIRSPL